MLEINSIQVNYGSQAVLKDVSLNLPAGQILALIGPNGAGKTTLLRAITGLQPLRSGNIRVAGQDITALKPEQRARLLAVVPQARNLPPDFTVYETVLLGRTPHVNWSGKTNSQDLTAAQRALELTQLAPFAHRAVGDLSGGEQQRVLVARALAQQAPLVLLDEPTTHLDLQHQSNLLNLLRRLVFEHDLAVLMVLHDINLASLYADQVALLVAGKVCAVGKPAEVVTVENLHRAYRIPIEVIQHPAYGTPLVLPDGRNEILKQ
ncbi:MAG: heme ABC transporter ATP-binding protein [Anaerolineales bacterium]|jgi:iron complex transport system ATP-binding protein|nr:heme ABC transporter ATP-binding protein [Anaerolineales bacterium]